MHQNFNNLLIEEIRKYEHLYNSSHPNHGRNNTSTWLTISNAVGGISITKCKKRWKTLRQRYAREHLRLTSVSKGAGEYVCNWEHIEAMEFISEFLFKSPNYLGDLSGTPKKDRLCRACLNLISLNAEKSYSTFNIFDDPSFAEKLQQCFKCINLQIIPWDEYSHSICAKCRTKVLNFFNFLTMCCDSVEKFDLMIKKQTEDRIESDEDEDFSETNSVIGYEQHSSSLFNKCQDVKMAKENDENVTKDQQESIENGNLLPETDKSAQCKDNTNLDENVHIGAEVFWNKSGKKKNKLRSSRTLQEDPLGGKPEDHLEGNPEDHLGGKTEYHLKKQTDSHLVIKNADVSDSEQKVNVVDEQTDSPIIIEEINGLWSVKSQYQNDEQNSFNDNTLSEQSFTDFIIEEVEEVSDNSDTEFSQIKIQVLKHNGVIEEDNSDSEHIIEKFEMDNHLQTPQDADLKIIQDDTFNKAKRKWSNELEANTNLETMHDDEFVEAKKLRTHDLEEDFIETDDIKADDIEVDNQLEIIREDMSISDKSEFEEISQKKFQKIYECDIENCTKTFQMEHFLKSHKIKVHKCTNIVVEKKNTRRTKYICDTCGKSLRDLSAFRLHKLTHVDQSQWPCACDVEGCTKRFKTIPLLNIHKKRHAGIREFKCPHCEVRKITKFELEQHMEIHSGLSFPCKSCSKVFSTSMSLYSHVANVHKNKLYETHACSFCDRVLSSVENKKIHELMHTQERTHECTTCGKKYHSDRALQSHMVMHAGPYVCEICGIKYSWPSNLKNHMIEHLKGVKAFACDQCDKSFKTSGNLKNHKMLHIDGTVPYKCEECGQGFRWAGSYYAHKKKHLKVTDEKEKTSIRTSSKKRNLAVSNKNKKKK